MMIMKTLEETDVMHEIPCTRLFVTVIIPSYNDSDRLQRCLDRVCRQTYPQNSYEVIVVDNGSNEDIRPTVEKYDAVKLLHEYRAGSYLARNLGIKHAKGEILAFTDSDCLPASNWIKTGVAQLINADNCGILGGSVNLFYENRSNPKTVELYDSITFFQQQRYIEKGHFSVTANLFTYKHVFGKVGLFNARLASGGDFEWCRRVYAAGFGLHYADDVTVEHPARHSFMQMVKKVARVTKGHFEMDNHKNNFVKNSIEILSKDVLPPVARTRSIWISKDIKGYSKKVKVTAVLLIMKYIVLIEKLKLLIKTGIVKHIYIKNSE